MSELGLGFVELGGKNLWVEDAVGGSNPLVEMDGDLGVDGKENSSVPVEVTQDGEVGLDEFCCSGRKGERQINR